MSTRDSRLVSLPALWIASLLACTSASANERPAFKHPLQRQLEAQVLPEVRFQDADLMDALVYLQLQAQAASENAVRVPFDVRLPADFQPRYQLTLHLKSVPFWDALRQLGGQAGVEISIVKNSVSIRPAAVAAAEKATVRTVIPAPEAPKPMSTRLREPARPSATGNGSHYTTSGMLQPQRSGYVRTRNLAGWSVTTDPGSRYSMNCADLAKCKAGCCEGGACGCFVCACQRP